MAVYKVPQDVEAEDKLIGPFSFRQFIYLIVAAIGMLLAWALSRIFIGLIIIPLPIIIAFLALALPLRKEQPMETYLTAVIRFYLKPRVRLWSPEGTISLVSITAPKTVQYQLTKNFSGAQASEQLSYLSRVVDSQGWSTRGVVGVNQSMSDIVVAEAQATEDVLDENTDRTRALDQRITQTDEARRQATLQQFQQAAAKGPVSVSALASGDSDGLVSDAIPAGQAPLDYNPYPGSMHQSVVSPSSTDDSNQPSVVSSQQAPIDPSAALLMTDDSPLSTNTQKSPSSMGVSPDIIRLANNNDLSISTLAHEAHRLSNDSEEVEISLR